MARLSCSILSGDEGFKAQLASVLRGSSLSIVSGERGAPGASSDVIVVDGRDDPAAAIAAVEHLRSADPTAGIFFVSSDVQPDAILRAMRAGANEFFAWPPSREALDEAVQRVASRRASSSPQQATTLVFLGAKGGAGTTTVAVNCAVEVARLSGRPTVIVDLKPGLGEVSLFLGVRSRYTLLDALDNLHRLDSDFLKELVVKHKSGLDMLAGSDQFDRPAMEDIPALEEVFRLLARQYRVHRHRRGVAGEPHGGVGTLLGRHGGPGGQPRRAVRAQRAAADRAPRAARAVRRARQDPAQSGRRAVPDFARAAAERAGAADFPHVPE